MTRPAAPELLEAASRELRRIRDDNLRIDKPDFHTMTGAIEELERRLSLAQTEINGHVRVIHELGEAVRRAQADERHATYQYSEAQARIAILEEELRRSKNAPA